MDLATQKSSKVSQEASCSHVEEHLTKLDHHYEAKPSSSRIPEEYFPSNTSSSDSEDSETPERKWRENTIEEKRRIKRKRKQTRRRQRMEKKRKEDQHIQHIKSQVQMYRSMARTFWDRWQWELLKRKEAMQRELKAKCVSGGLDKGAQATSRQIKVPEIEPVHLVDPIKNGKPTEVYLGRGSFSVVRLQFYRSLKVAVKEFLPRSLREDVKNEATILSLLTHPYLPYVFGMCTTSQPYRIIIQFHGIDSETITLHRELCEHSLEISNPVSWLILCTQLLEAIEYVHKRKILHNDIKSNNVLITTSLARNPIQAGASTSTECQAFNQHIVLIDFGKATPISPCRRYNLSEPEKVEYLINYPHIAPEVVHGESKQSTYSDMYSKGKIFEKMFDNKCFRMFPKTTKEELLTIINKLKSFRWHKRLSAEQTLVTINSILY